MGGLEPGVVPKGLDGARARLYETMLEAERTKEEMVVRMQALAASTAQLRQVAQVAAAASADRRLQESRDAGAPPQDFAQIERFLEGLRVQWGE